MELITGENFFIIMPRCNTDCMQVYLEQLSKKYAEDIILIVCDGAAWHISRKIKMT